MKKLIPILVLLAYGLIPAHGAIAQSASPSEPSHRPKVALVLSGGGARGFAHIGVLKVIRQIGIPIDLVVGTSMGSIIGGLYAAGYSPAELQTIASRIDWGRLFTDQTPRSGYSFAEQSEESTVLATASFDRSGIVLSRGLVSGRGILSLLSCLTLPVSQIHDFRNLPIPFCAVAADLGSGEEVHLLSGNLSRALRASMSAPGVFAPIEIGGRLLVDGGVLNNLPVDVARQLGADIVIAVDITSPLEKVNKINDTVAVLRQMLKIEMVQSTRRHRKEATVLITPELGNAGFADFGSYAKIIADGEKAAEKARPELEALAAKLKAAGAGGDPAGADTAGGAKTTQMLVHFRGIIKSGGKAADERYLRSRLSGKGEEGVAPLDLFELSRHLEDTGRYQSVTFQLTPESPGVNALHVRFLPVKPDTASLGLGLRFRYQSGDELHTGLSAHIGGTVNDLLTPASSWLTDLYVGNTTGAETLYHQRIAAGFYLEPEFHAGTSLHSEWTDGQPVGRRRLGLIGGELGAGFRPNARFTLAGGYGIEWRSLSPFVGGSYVAPVASGRDTYLFGRLDLDTRDNIPFPSRGLFFRLQYRYAATDLGGTRTYQYLRGEGGASVSFLDRHTLSFGLDAATSFGYTLPADLVFGFGGPDRFVGYHTDEVLTDNYASIALEYRIRIAGLPPQLPSDLPFGVYLYVRGNVGTIWQTPASFDPLGNLSAGGTVGIAAVTPAGEVRVELWTSDRQRFIAFVSIGSSIFPQTRISPFDR